MTFDPGFARNNRFQSALDVISTHPFINVAIDAIAHQAVQVVVIHVLAENQGAYIRVLLQDTADELFDGFLQHFILNEEDIRFCCQNFRHACVIGFDAGNMVVVVLRFQHAGKTVQGEIPVTNDKDPGAVPV